MPSLPVWKMADKSDCQAVLAFVAFPSKPVPARVTSPPVFRYPAPIRAVVAVAACLLAAAASAAPAFTGWDIRKHDGRDYVSAESVKSAYRFHSLVRSGRSVSLTSPKVVMKLSMGGRECLMNGVKFVFSNPVVAIGDKPFISRIDLAKLIDPVLRPSFIPNAANFRTVILDPGHGGKDPGATNSLGTEAASNLKLAARAKTMLEAKGFRVVMTRTSDRYLSLQERVDLANSVRENAVFISIHFNSGGREARGIETFTLSPPGVSHYGRDLIATDSQARTGNEHDSANIALATAVHGCLLRRLQRNTFDRGIKRARFNVLSGVRHPAILLEGGFMTHPYEARLIHNDAYQNALATGITEAILKYRHAISLRPAARMPR